MKMFKKMSGGFYSVIIPAVLFVASLGVFAASVCWDHQPEIPAELRK